MSLSQSSAHDGNQSSAQGEPAVSLTRASNSEVAQMRLSEQLDMYPPSQGMALGGMNGMPFDQVSKQAGRATIEAGRLT